MPSNTKIRVLRIINRLNLGGPTHNAAYLTKYLGAHFETKLLSGMKDETEASSEYLLEKLEIKPVYISDMHRSLHPIKDFKSYLEIKKIIQEFKPHIVHTHAAKAGAVGRLAAIHSNVPVILHTFHGHIFHSYFSSFTTKVFQKIEQYLAKKTSGIITISNLQKKELVEDFHISSPEKAFVIPLGFDLQKFVENQPEKRNLFRTKYDLDSETVAIGIVGRLVPVKNHSLFLEAFLQTKKKSTKKCRGFIIGDGEDRQKIEQLCETLGLSFSSEEKNNAVDITFTSWIKEIDVAYAGLDIVCLTSLNEGTPVSLIEAAAAGKSIVTTNVGGIADFLEDGVTGHLVNTFNATDFSEKLLLVLNQENSQTNQSKKIMEQFSYMRLVNDMQNLYTKLLTQKGIQV